VLIYKLFQYFTFNFILNNFLAPNAPRDFVIKSDSTILTKTFGWSYAIGGQQDAVIVRICRNNQNRTCVFEKKLLYKTIPTELVVEPTFGNDEYVAYAFTQSKGRNSSFSNKVTFVIGKYLVIQNVLAVTFFFVHSRDH